MHSQLSPCDQSEPNDVSADQKKLKGTQLLRLPLKVINVGVEGFARDLASANVDVVHVSWMPPVGGDPLFATLLAHLDGDERIQAANDRAFQRILDGEPDLIDVQPAADVIPELRSDQVLLHAGPPITWDRMCGPMRGAICGAIVYEGWADNLESAERMATQGEIEFHPNHHFGIVGPMTGIVTRSMPLFVVENQKFGNHAYSTINEGLGKVMRFGGNDSEVLARLYWLRDVLGPALSAALRACKGIPLKTMVARGLMMGDEMHQRNVACTGIFLREISPYLAQTARSIQELTQVLKCIGSNDQFFLNIAMAAAKSIIDQARNIEGSSVVTAMCRNGTDFGIRLSGTNDQWFTAPVELPEGLYFPGFTAADANGDMGDSAIVETVGLGAFAMAASPAVVGFVGAGSSSAANYTQTMREITIGESPVWTIPALEFAGVPTGIDARLVAETSIAPAINTGIAHKQAGIGQIGAGVARAPLACFTQGLKALSERMAEI